MNIPLYSWHEPGYSLTEGSVDWERSPYHNDARILRGKQAYAELKALLGTDQVIWCYTKDDFYDHSGSSKVGWILSVSEEKIFRIINNDAWNILLGQLDYYPSALKEKWTAEARKIADRGSTEYDALIRNNIDQYLSGETKQQVLDKLFIDAPYEKAFIENKSIAVLLKHPIPESWVIRSDYRNIKY